MTPRIKIAKSAWEQPDFTRTRAAMAAYDEHLRRPGWEDAWTTEEIRACTAADTLAFTKVREAYALDTSSPLDVQITLDEIKRACNASSR